MRRRFFLTSAAALSVSGVRAAPTSVSILVGLRDWPLRNDSRIAAVVTKYHASPGGMQGAFIKAMEWVIPDKTDAAAFIADMLATGLVKYAEIDELKTFAPPVTPNDPQIGTAGNQQWYVMRSASAGSINLGPTTDATSAWGQLNAISTSIKYGDVAVKVGDVNGGYTAPAIDAIPNVGTGWKGFNQNSNTNDVASINGCSAGHGTLCAMLIGAATDNGQDVAGVAAGCTFYPYVAAGFSSCSPFPAGTLSYTDAGLVNCLNAAITAGINSLSITIAGGGAPGASVLAALIAAWNGGIFLCAPSGDVGNAGNAPQYPCNVVSPALCVSGNAYDGSASDYAGFGNRVAILAPGGSISPTSAFPFILFDGSVQTALGTSFSAPYLAGVGALVCSANSHLRGNPTAIAECLIGSTIPATGQVGWNQHAGLGIVQADKAVAMAIAGAWPNNQGGLLGVQ